MKTAVILNAASDPRYMFDKAFGGRSAYMFALEWASSISEQTGIFILAAKNTCTQCREEAAAAGISVTVIEKDVWIVAHLLDEISALTESSGAGTAVYAYADCPFLDKTLTAELLLTHEKYAAEYTLADGYPYGFAPELLDKGISAILAQLAKTKQKKLGDSPVERNSIGTLLKTDINSFEIETVLAPKDWRLYRFEFVCGSKAGLAACRALYGSSAGSGADAEQLSEIAAGLVSVLKTVPGFYNVQIDSHCPAECTYCPYPEEYKKKYGFLPSSEKTGRMTIERFRLLVKQMASLSEKAVVALSAWGEPLLHPDFIDFVKAAADEDGLSVMIETDGLLITEELCKAVKDAVDKKVLWIVSLDAATEKTYAAMRGSAGTLEKAAASVPLLETYFPGSVYPQFVRTNTNESELEQFYRYWKDEKSPSGGELIIQKYDSFGGLLPDCRPADLSPVERNPCWHIRRDMTILADGSVPLCREYMFTTIIGNVFEESLESVWEKITPYVSKDMKGTYDEKCRKCDEYYTFNF
jgi:spiro-SPASM protein